MPPHEQMAAAELERLCPTCLALAASRYLARFGPPLEDCEECQRLRQVREALAPTEGDPPRGGPARSQARERKGLCADCESRDTCALSDSPAGVWYCSEYR